MRIVHVMLTKKFAGTERHVVELTSAQAEMGHEVFLILRRRAARDAPEAIARRVDPRVKVILVGDWILRWPSIPRARQVVRRLQPDIAHAHLGMACRALRGLEGRMPRVTTLHIDFDPALHDHLDGIVAIAPWQLADVPASLRRRSVQIDNWTGRRSPSIDARRRLRGEIGVGDDEFLFGAVGRVVASKGMDVLVDAFRQAKPPKARLAIVGDGRDLDALRARAGNDVALPGFSATPEDWMAAFDCFVSPSREEPFGLVLLEAMQAGLPIVATATPGAMHLASRIGGPLIPTGDVPALGAALRSVNARRPARMQYPMDDLRVEAKAIELEAFYADLRQQVAAPA